MPKGGASVMTSTLGPPATGAVDRDFERCERFAELEKLIEAQDDNDRPVTRGAYRARRGSLRAQLLNEHAAKMRERNADAVLLRKERELALFRSNRGEPSIWRIALAVAEYTGVSVALMLRRSKVDDIAQARQLVMYLTRILTSQSLSEIGKFFRVHHTTVLYGIRKVDLRRKLWAEWASAIKDLATLLRLKDTS